MACAQAMPLRAPLVFTSYDLAPHTIPQTGDRDTDNGRAAPLGAAETRDRVAAEECGEPAATIFFISQSSASRVEYRRRSG